ncbi:hypothetical protein HPP92_018260 [Vanilla planifolia]|uniref:PhoD-like phosphatase metallophosphatase domain-containing protein n=1 Tax=Vanilla planifolia TaxID=51239 RepID=A0A835QAP8_VANPL|nr:hypothetical protein HPP92_018876 [Vanilla planifolia]KAG0468932.1 hypothetical protein HPP92_018260 [Vanilla planifolia]
MAAIAFPPACGSCGRRRPIAPRSGSISGPPVRLCFEVTALARPVATELTPRAPPMRRRQPAPPLNAVVSRLAFGSCANQSARQPIWDAIVEFDPQVFIWLGDNIYGDNRRPLRLFGVEATIGPWKNTPRFFPSTEVELRRRYQLAKSQPGYGRLRQRTRVIGTWDDHDYGLNDAGKEFGGKNISQRLLLDFLDEPEDSPRRKQAGVYASYVFGPHGQQVKWEWLEKELYGPETEITIIASSIQVVSNLSATTGPFFYMESWGRFPKERERLYQLIAKSKRGGVFFISGDVHFAEITRSDCACEYPLYDFTSSGLTQAVERAVPPPLHYLLRIAAWLTPTTMRVYSPTCQYKSCAYGKPNFGSIQIDWSTVPPRIKIEVRSVNGDPVNMVELSLAELQPKRLNRVRAQGIYQRHCSLEVELPWFLRYRLAFAFLGSITSNVLGFFSIKNWDPNSLLHSS